jgi:SAM-dependent methyltransferase
LKILLIGPRSETELYSVKAAGFSMENVKALDLFSYSPLVTPGDMHAPPFDDNSFDIVFITAVLSYSKNVSQVASEVKRVLKDGGHVAFVEPMHYDFLLEEEKTELPKAYDKAHDLEKAPAFYGRVDDVLKIFGDSVSEVNFRSDPSPPYDGWGLMIATVFRIRKTSASS